MIFIKFWMVFLVFCTPGFALAGKEKKTSKRSDSFNRLIAGQLSQDHVDAVLKAVCLDPKRNGEPLQKQTRNNKNEKCMLEDTLKESSEFEDEQECCPDCIPPRPNLEDLYNMLLKTVDEEKKLREKKDNFLRALAENDTKIVEKLIHERQDSPLGDELPRGLDPNVI